MKPTDPIIFTHRTVPSQIFGLGSPEDYSILNVGKTIEVRREGKYDEILNIGVKDSAWHRFKQIIKWIWTGKATFHSEIKTKKQIEEDKLIEVANEL